MSPEFPVLVGILALLVINTFLLAAILEALL